MRVENEVLYTNYSFGFKIKLFRPKIKKKRDNLKWLIN